MELGKREINVGFLYHKFLEKWDELGEAVKRSRLLWSVIGAHLWHEVTDEGFMLEIRLHRKERALRAETK
jgi:hypothetical protein